MGDISRMASCSAGKHSAAALRRKLETCQGERAKSLQPTALLLSVKSSLLGKSPPHVMVCSAVKGRDLPEIPQWESRGASCIGSGYFYLHGKAAG